MSAILKGLLFALVVMCSCAAHADQSPASIDASTCVDKAQLAALEVAGQKNDLFAMRTLELYYMSCVGNHVEWLRWAKKAAEIGTASDVVTYATVVETSSNAAKAFPLYLKAAQMGDSMAQYWVAKAYRDGNGVPKNKDAALMWFELGANCHGHTNTDTWGLIDMNALAQYLLTEQSIPLAKVKGLAWLNVVANSRAGLSHKEDAARKELLGSLSGSDADMVGKLTDELSAQAGCDSNNPTQ